MADMQPVSFEQYLMTRIVADTIMLELLQRRQAMVNMEQQLAAAKKQLAHLETIANEKQQLEAERDALAAEKSDLEAKYNSAVDELCELRLSKIETEAKEED